MRQMGKRKIKKGRSGVSGGQEDVQMGLMGIDCMENGVLLCRAGWAGNLIRALLDYTGTQAIVTREARDRVVRDEVPE
jgi:hypothetical protein